MIENHVKSGALDPDDISDMQKMAEKLSRLPRDQLMYVAGAIHMAGTLLPVKCEDGQKGA